MKYSKKEKKRKSGENGWSKIKWHLTPVPQMSPSKINLVRRMCGEIVGQSLSHIEPLLCVGEHQPVVDPLCLGCRGVLPQQLLAPAVLDRKSTRLYSSHSSISYA